MVITILLFALSYLSCFDLIISIVREKYIKYYQATVIVVLAKVPTLTHSLSVGGDEEWRGGRIEEEEEEEGE